MPGTAGGDTQHQGPLLLRDMYLGGSGQAPPIALQRVGQLE